VSGIGATSQLVRIAVDATVAGLAIGLSSALGARLWPTGWPLGAQLVLALVVAELAQYWLHRWQHEQDWLWRFHAVHHSAPRLYWLNAARFHPFDVGLLYAFGYVPLVLLGCPADVIALFALFDAVFGMLQHANIEMRLGALNRIFSAAGAHRWHHSRSVAGATPARLEPDHLGHRLRYLFPPRDRRPPTAIGIASLPRFSTATSPSSRAPFAGRLCSAPPSGGARKGETCPSA
jgi:hypothetical protein